MKAKMIMAAVLFIGTIMAQDVNYNFDQGADFAKFKTYKWVPIKDAAQPDQITAKQITDAFDSELAKKGLSKIDSDKADLYIGYQIGIDKEKSINAYSMGGGPWGGGARWGGGMTTATTSTVIIGQVVLDMYDSGAKQLVWRGTASKTVDPNVKPDKRAANIQKGAAKMLKNYPPKAK